MRRIWVTAVPITDAVRSAASAAGATEIIDVTKGYPRALTEAGISTVGYHEIPAPLTDPRETNRATIEQRAGTAMAANETYLAIGTPSNAQNTAQVKLLTRECQGILRLILNQLDTTNGT